MIFLLFHAGAYAQEPLSIKLFLNVKNVRLVQALKTIEKQAGVKFAYSDDDIAQTLRFSGVYNNVPLCDILNDIARSFNLKYDLIGTVIVLHKNMAPVPAYGETTAASKFITVKGRVTDREGMPLAGVSVRQKGAETHGTITDTNGNFNMNTGEQAALMLSLVGYRSLNVDIAGRTPLNVILIEDPKALAEVVVVGYGTQKRENVIGSISQITAEQLEGRPEPQLQNALTGQMPGVTITQTNPLVQNNQGGGGGRPGFPGGSITIRGVGTFGRAGSAALILVDDIPVDDLNNIDPNDIESISVLKDASSAAIYGSRAANGVILITTRMGKKGRPVVAYNGYAGFQQATAFPDYLDSYDYASAYNLARPGTFSAADLQLFKDGTDPDGHPNTQFLKAILSEHGLQTANTLSVSGGGPLSRFNISGGYLSQNGLVIKNNYSKANFRFNFNSELGKHFELTTRLSAISSNINEPAAGGVLNVIDQAVKLPAIYVGIYQNGDFGDGINQNGTPLSNLASQSFYKTSQFNLNGNMRFDYKVVPALKLSVIGGYIRTDGQSHSFFATQKLHSITLMPNSLTEGTSYNGYYTWQGLADFSRHFGNSQVTVLAGYSFEHYLNQSVTAFRDNLPGNDLHVIDVGSLANQQSGGSSAESALESEFMRANYGYAGKYLIEVVARRDGSSRFPVNRKYATFPSAAIGWRMGEERFIKKNIPAISELKLKGSFGVLGNQNIGNYPYQNVLVTDDSNDHGTDYSFGGTIAPGVQKQTLTDNTLHWESTRTTDAGIEFGLFKNGLNGSVTYFDKYTYDILYAPTSGPNSVQNQTSSVSSVLGYKLSEQNTGSMSNKGWEFTLNYNGHVGDFTYFVNSNFSIINNKVLSLGIGNVLQTNGLIGNGSTLFVGYPYQLFYGYVADKIFTDAHDVATYPNQTAINPSVQPGDIRYKDLNNDGKVTTADRTVLGSQIPHYTYGATLGGAFKGFDFKVLLQGVAGVKGYLFNNEGFAFWNGANVQRWQYEGAWTPQNPNPNAVYPRLEIFSSAGSGNSLTSSFWVINASYLRIKNAQMGYTIPQKTSAKIGISNIRVFLSGDNLHTFSHYRQGWDPEISGQGNYYPILETVTLGISAKF